MKIFPFANRTLVLLTALTLVACGGGGGGDSSDAGGGAPAVTRATLSRDNGKQLADAALSFASLSSEHINTFPTLITYFRNVFGTGAIDQTEDCFSGTVTYRGTLTDAGSQSDLSFLFSNCSNGNGLIANGSLQVIVNQVDGNQVPIDFQVNYSNYVTRSTNGNINLTIDGSVDILRQNGTTSVSVHMTVTDNLEDLSISTDDLAILYPNSSGYTALRDGKLNGSVEHSGWGLFDVSADEAMSGRLYLDGEGSAQLRVDIVDGTTVELAFDGEGDNVYDAFVIAPILELEKTYDDNTAPTINIADVADLEKNTEAEISLEGVTDNEFDFLDYTVSLQSGPGGSNTTVVVDGARALHFSADAAGDYTLELSVSDGRGGSATETLDIHVMQDAPEIDLASDSFAITAGASFNLSLTPVNSEDGPFSYRLLAAPPGMTVDGDGQLDWQSGSESLFFPELSLNILVEVSNTDHAVEVPLSINVSDPGKAHPLVRTGIEVPVDERNIHVGDFDNDGITEVMLTDNHNLIYTLEYRAGVYVQDWVFPYALPTEGATVDAILPDDSDGDGHYEIYVLSGGHISVIDRDSNRIDRQVSLEAVAGQGYAKGYGIALADLDGSGDKRLIVLVGEYTYNNDTDAYILKRDDLTIDWQLKGQSLGRALAVGNVDNDTATELVFAAGFVYDGASHANEWLYGDNFGNDVVVGDIDGDGRDDIVADRGANTVAVYDAVAKSLAFEIPETDTCSIALADIDADPSQEAIIGNCQWGNVSAYDAGASSATLKWQVSSQSHGTESLAIGDSDQDGHVEVLWGTGLSTTGEDSLVVFDTQTQTVDFRNQDPAQLGSPYIGGLRKIGDLGEESVMFAVAGTDSGYAGSRLISIDPATGHQLLSPEQGSNWTGFIDFCIGDLEQDGGDEIYLSSAEAYDSFLAVYDPDTATTAWSLSGSNRAGGDISCGDINNDGYTDIAVAWGNTVQLYDPANQALIWSSTELGTTPNQVEVYDLDHDGTLEIVALMTDKLVVYKKSGANYLEDGTYTEIDSDNFRSLAIEDVDGDGNAEIVIVARDSYQFQSSSTHLIVLDNQLAPAADVILNGFVTALGSPDTASNSLLIGISTFSENNTSGQADDHRVALISLENGQVIWQSPLLLGTVASKSQLTPALIGGIEALSFGTDDAMYITR